MALATSAISITASIAAMIAQRAKKLVQLETSSVQGCPGLHRMPSRIIAIIAQTVEATMVVQIARM